MIDTKALAPLDPGRRNRIEFLDLGKGDIDLGTTALAALGDQLRQAMQGLRPEDDVDIGRALDDRRPFLGRDAAANADDQSGLALLEQTHPPQIVEHPLLRLFAHRAGVEEDDVRLFGIVGLFNAFGGPQNVGHLVRVVLVHLAAKGTDIKLLHR